MNEARLARTVRRLRRYADGRALLAAKAAIACAVAWYLAPLVPFAEDDYSYYAPLGVVVSMYPTVVGSVRGGMQTLAGVGLGLAIGIGGIGVVDLLGAPAVVGLVLVVAVGVLAGAIRRLGPGGDWVAMAGMFVLLIGGANAGEYSVSYLVTLALGVVVGVLMNLLVLPPLHLEHASGRLSVLRDEAAGRVREIADVVADGDARGADGVMEDLAALAAAVTGDVIGARESARANPRGRRHRDVLRMNDIRREALERAVLSVRGLGDALFHDGDDPLRPLPRSARDALVVALRAGADVLGTPVGDENAEPLLDVAERALDDYRAALEADEHAAEDAVTAAFCMSRIIELSRPVSASPV